MESRSRIRKFAKQIKNFADSGGRGFTDEAVIRARRVEYIIKKLDSAYYRLQFWSGDRYLNLNRIPELYQKTTGLPFEILQAATEQDDKLLEARKTILQNEAHWDIDFAMTLSNARELIEESYKNFNEEIRTAAAFVCQNTALKFDPKAYTSFYDPATRSITFKLEEKKFYTLDEYKTMAHEMAHAIADHVYTQQTGQRVSGSTKTNDMGVSELDAALGENLAMDVLKDLVKDYPVIQRRLNHRYQAEQALSYMATSQNVILDRLLLSKYTAEKILNEWDSLQKQGKVFTDVENILDNISQYGHQVHGLSSYNLARLIANRLHSELTSANTGLASERQAQLLNIWQNKDQYRLKEMLDAFGYNASATVQEEKRALSQKIYQWKNVEAGIVEDIALTVDTANQAPRTDFIQRYAEDRISDPNKDQGKTR